MFVWTNKIVKQNYELENRLTQRQRQQIQWGDTANQWGKGGLLNKLNWGNYYHY